RLQGDPGWPRETGLRHARTPPGMGARLEQCRQLARERGDTPHTGTGAGGMRDFVRDCMRGKQR
ncbi:MAG TPA: hypothetical protein VK579_19590, partial [Terriglobales bacterium]|nr:hypothetical protein [Terriglobales bacterium]